MLDANNDRIVVLARGLATATTLDDVQWEVEGADTFVWKRVEGTVTIGSRDADGEPPYELTIYNGSRVKVDVLRSQLLPSDEPAPWNEALADLYRAARRNALHVDALIEALINLLPTTRLEGRASIGS